MSNFGPSFIWKGRSVRFTRRPAPACASSLLSCFDRVPTTVWMCSVAAVFIHLSVMHFGQEWDMGLVTLKNDARERLLDNAVNSVESGLAALRA